LGFASGIRRFCRQDGARRVPEKILDRKGRSAFAKRAKKNEAFVSSILCDPSRTLRLSPLGLVQGESNGCYIVLVDSRSKLFLLLLAASLLSACNRGGSRAQEIAYVSAPQAFLRDQVATVYSKTGIVKNGDAVRILGRERRFARVRTSDGTEGWIEQRFLISKQTYEQFQKLARDEQNDPVQATGITRNAT